MVGIEPHHILAAGI